jgi:acetyl-CoA synthetase
MPNTPDASDHNALQSSLIENRVFSVPADFAERVGGAHFTSLDEYKALHARSIEDPEGFWSEAASTMRWTRKWDRVLDWQPPDARWFVGGRTNLCDNCVDRHVDAGHGDQVAIIWESEPVDANGQPEVRRLTYRDLQRETARFANVLKGLGVEPGHVVTIYMGMVPELAIAILACARIGAAHSVIFGGFSSQSIADRIADASSRVVITCDGLYRRGKAIPLKDNVDAAIAELGKGASPHTVEAVVVLRRTGTDIAWHEDRDQSWDDLMAMVDDYCPCEPLDSEHPAFLLYTSGSTGKPKGIMHTVGGYMVFTALTAKHTFNLTAGLAEPKRAGGPDGHVFWCTADIGWITGHSYIVYGILANRIPTVMYEGAPNFPAEDRFWAIVDRHQVTHFYTAPTAIRAFMKWGDEHPAKHNLSSLRVLGTVGEPINPEAWMWYHIHIGKQRCPIVDTYWQTETGGHICTPIASVTPTKPGSCTLPFLGVDAAIVNARGEEMPPNTGGLFVIRKPWPGMLRGVYGDRQRFIDTYWSSVIINGQPVYTAGDGARRDEDGYFWIMGRIDDVINVSGHRMGTMEIESALVAHDAVVEAAVVGMPHEIKGTGIAAFCTLAPSFSPSPELAEALRDHVARVIGAIARPDQIRFTDVLPKTRSGKIMRRLLRDIAAGEENIKQDVTTLEDYSILAKLRESSES